MSVNQIGGIISEEIDTGSQYRTTKLWVLAFATFPLLGVGLLNYRLDIAFVNLNIEDIDIPVFIILFFFVVLINFFIIFAGHRSIAIQMDRNQQFFIICLSLLIALQVLNTTRSTNLTAAVSLDIRLLFALFVFILMSVFFTGDEDLISKTLKVIIISSTVLLVIYMFRYLVVLKSNYLSIDWTMLSRRGRNLMGFYLAIVTPISVWKYISGRLFSWWIIPTVVHLFALVYTLSRGAWTSTAVSLLLIFLLHIYQSRIKENEYAKSSVRIFRRVIVATLLFAIVFLVLTNSVAREGATSRIQSLLELEDVGSEVSISRRKEMMDEGISRFIENPIIGIGTSNYLSETGYITHNDYLSVLCEQGIFGIALFLVLIFLVLRKIFLLSRYTWESMALKNSSLAIVVYMFLFNALIWSAISVAVIFALLFSLRQKEF